MLLCCVVASGVVGHNGVVHRPGESSSIGVARAYDDNHVTVYNYGQNYVRVHAVDSDEVLEPVPWPKAYMPIAATAVSDTQVLALVEDNTEIKLIIVDASGAETPVTEGCPDPENKLVFVDRVQGNQQTALDLTDGTVFAIEVGVEPHCTGLRTPPLEATAPPLMVDGARFYGYAENDDRRCWFYGFAETGAIVQCFDSDENSIFKSDRMDDGHVDPRNFHTGGDIFFEGNCLYLANGDTNPGSLRNTRVQSEDYWCGKLISWCADNEPTIAGVGLRHPWTSVSVPNGRRLIADVGQETCEEISVFEFGQPRTANFGWPKFECDILRGSVSWYNRRTVDAALFYTDRDRNGLPSLEFVFYLVLAAGLVGAVASYAFDWATGKATTKSRVAAICVFITVCLAQMAAAPGYVGYDNGIFATHIRTLIDTVPRYPEWYAMLVFLAIADVTLVLGVMFGSRWLLTLGDLSAFIYLVTFLALLQPPAVVTPLPVFAFVAIVALGYALLPAKPTYNLLN